MYPCMVPENAMCMYLWLSREISVMLSYVNVPHEFMILITIMNLCNLYSRMWYMVGLATKPLFSNFQLS